MACEALHDPISAASLSLQESNFTSSLVSTYLQKTLFFHKDGQDNFVFVCLFQKFLPMFLKLPILMFQLPTRRDSSWIPPCPDF